MLILCIVFAAFVSEGLTLEMLLEFRALRFRQQAGNPCVLLV